MKKFIALLLSLTLMISAFSTVGAFALEDTPEVDKSVLLDVLTEGMPVGGRYTPESLEAFETARVQAQAVYDDPNATQEQVDKAAEDLQKALNNIEAAEVDVTKLEELLDSASYYIENKDKYTTISYKAFKDAFSQAQCQYFLGNVQSEIDAAYNSLDTAIKNLILITDTPGVFKEYVDSRKPITKNRTYVYTELTDIGDYKVVYGGYSEKRTNNYSKYVGGYCFKLNCLVSPDSLAVYLVKKDQVITLEDAFRDGLVSDMKVVVDAFNSCEYKDDMVIEFVKNEKSLKQKIQEKFGDIEVKDYRYIFTWGQYDVAYASGDTENKECSDNFGDYKFTSTITSTPYDMGIYCVTNEKAYTLIGAYENDLISDVYPLLRTISEKDSRYSYVNTNPTIESDFYEYAGLSKSSGFFEIIGETEDYKVCCGGSDGFTCLYYSHVIGEYEFISPAQAYPYDLALFIYKDGAFKKLHESYLDGDIDIDEVVGLIKDYQYVSNNIKPLTKIEIGKIGDYTLYYKGLEVNGNYSKTVNLGEYEVRVKGQFYENDIFAKNYGSTVLGLYLEDNNGNTTDLQSAYDTGLITDPQAVADMLGDVENSSKYFDITSNTTNPTDPTIESEFYKYAGLSESEAFFEVLGETEDYKVCRGGSLIGTEAYYSHIIGEYEFVSPVQPYPYDLALFIYKDGAFKKLHQSYLDGDIDIDEVVGLITNGTYISGRIKPLIKIEIGKIGDYTLYYKGLQANCYYSETIKLGKYEICVYRQFNDKDAFAKNYSSTVLGLYLEDNNGNTTDLQSAYDTGLITDSQAVVNMLGDVEDSSKYFDITLNTTNPTDPKPTTPTNPTDPTDGDEKDILENPQPVKKANPITVKSNTITVKAKTLKTKKVTKEALKITKAKGKVSVAITKITLKGKKVSKKIANKFSITSKGNLTMGKALTKGNYKITAKVVAKGNVHYRAKTLTKAFTVKVK